MRLYKIIGLLCSLSCCSNHQKPVEESSLHSLDTSTKIIVNLLEKRALQTILEPSTHEELNRLIKNFSPAEMALEAEVLNWPQPAILFFAQKANHDYQIMYSLLQVAARTHEQEIKFIEIDVDELFKITEQFELETIPALLLMNERQEISRTELLNSQNFESELCKLIQKKEGL